MIGKIMMDVSGLSLNADEKIKLAKPAIGGVILFSRNYQTREQLKKLIKSIRRINPNLLIAVDHEGGRVQRFKDDFTLIPPMSLLGKAFDKNQKQGLELAFNCGFVMAYELLEIGVDFSFAPVLDIDYKNSSVIGDRAFHSSPKVITKLALSLTDGMHAAGMKCVGKHFPGHGFVRADSHLELPIDNREMSEIKTDIKVFTSLFAKLDAIMPAHIIYSKVDDKPAGFSNIWLKDILKTKLGFNGVIFSDDLSMLGASFIKDIKDRVKTSLDNGCDMALICNNPELVDKVIDENWGQSRKLSSMHGNFKINKEKYLKIKEKL